MRMKAEDLQPKYFLVGDGRTRLFVHDVEVAGDKVIVTHHWGQLEFDVGTDVDAARPMEPKILPSDL